MLAYSAAILDATLTSELSLKHPGRSIKIRSELNPEDPRSFSRISIMVDSVVNTLYTNKNDRTVSSLVSELDELIRKEPCFNDPDFQEWISCIKDTAKRFDPLNDLEVTVRQGYFSNDIFSIYVLQRDKKRYSEPIIVIWESDNKDWLRRTIEQTQTILGSTLPKLIQDQKGNTIHE